jgi:hypothetical protein
MARLGIPGTLCMSATDADAAKDYAQVQVRAAMAAARAAVHA